MDAQRIEVMLQGANVLACLAIATFFLRSWTRSRDTFFLLFALAFATFAANRFWLALISERDESLAPYLVRLAAFLLIAGAIIHKNRGVSPPDAVRSEREG